jgi:hypothetical protein
MTVSRKMAGIGGGVQSRLVYVGCGGNDPAYFTILREHSNGEIEFVNAWQPANVNYNVSETRVDPTGQFAYLTNTDYDELRILDVSDPLNILDLGAYSDATYLDRPYSLWVDYAAKVAFVKGNEYLTALDVSDHAAITKLDHISYTASQWVAVDSEYDLAFCPRYSATEAIVSFDISSPAAMPNSYEARVASTSYYDQISRISVDPVNKLMFGSAITEYLTSHSYTAAGIITLEQAWLTTYDSINGHAVDPERKLLFLSVDKPHPENYGIAVIDYSDPTNMVEIAYISFYETVGNAANTRSYYMHWDADWQRLLVTASATAVYVDISDGAAPTVLGYFTDTTRLNAATTIRPAGDIS